MPNGNPFADLIEPQSANDNPFADLLGDEPEQPPAPQQPEEPGRVTRMPQTAGDWARFMLGGVLHPIRQAETLVEQFATQTGLAPEGSRLMPGASLSRAMETPLASIPQIPQQEGKMAQVGAGLGNAVIDFANFFATPEGIATLGLGTIPATARKVILADFAASMATSAPEQFAAGYQAAKEGNIQEAARQLTGGTGGVVLSASIGRQLAKPAATHPSVTLPRSMAALEKTAEEFKVVPFPPEAREGTKVIPWEGPVERGVKAEAGETIQEAMAVGRLIGNFEETVAAKELAKETNLKTASQLAWLDRAKKQTPEEPLIIAAEAVIRPDRAVELIQTWERGEVPEGRGVGAEFEGTYPPTAEQLGTFQSRGPGGPQSSTGYVAPGRPVQSARPPGIGTTPTQRPVPGVVPPETLQGEFPPARPVTLGEGEFGPPPEAVGEWPPPRPPALGSPEKSLRGEWPPPRPPAGLIRGTPAEQWADRVLGEDPRAGGPKMLPFGAGPKDVQRVAALVVKGAALIEQGARDFAKWSAQMVRDHGDEIRPHLEEIWKRSQVVFGLKEEQISAGEGLRTGPSPASTVQEPGPSPARPVEAAHPSEQALGITPQAPPLLKRIAGAAAGFGRWYSEWMPDRVRRIQRVGGTKAADFADKANEVLSKTQEHYGSLTPVLNEAKEAAGQSNQATRWMHGMTEITDRAAISHGPDAVEGHISVPGFAQPLVALVKQANLAIGQLLEPVTEGFKATGKWQRNLTGFGYDLIRRGEGATWEAWTRGLAKANNLPVDKVQAFFRNWKAILDETGSSDVARIEKVNQDFVRDMPRAITHVQVDGPLGGRHWEQVIHANLSNYLESSAKRASAVRAFREQFPKGTFGETFRGVMSEIPGEFKGDMETTVRSLQGHPSDSYALAAAIGLAPDQPIGATFRMLNQTVGDFMSRLVLTGQLLTQTPETGLGATQIFLGYKNWLTALARYKELYPQMELNGQVSRMIYDNSFDPSSPIRSRWRQAGNLITRGFAENLLNEFQEGMAGATARVVREKIDTGALSEWEQSTLPQTFQAMGFTRPQAEAMMKGNKALLDQFERKAAAFLTSGNKALAQGSRIGANRLFNSVFRFQAYPMMKLNQMRGVWRAVGSAFEKGFDMEKGFSPEQSAALRLLGRWHFGTLMQGAMYSALTSLFFDQLFGAKVKGHEASDEPLQFVGESFLSAMGGPLYMVWRGARTQGTLGIVEQATRTFFPYQIMSSLWDMTHGEGSYRDLDAGDRLGKFVETRVPGARLLSSGLSVFGLGQENKKLQTSIKAFNRWRAGELGFERTESYLKLDPGKEFRMEMKKATEALQKGDRKAYMQALMRASGAPTAKPDSIAKSLRARKKLENPKGGPLTIEQMVKLRQHIGREAVQRLVYYDAMLEAAAEGLVLPPKK